MLDIFPTQRVCGVTVLLMRKAVLFQTSGVLECSKSLSDCSYMDAYICKNSSSVYLRLWHSADFTAYVIFLTFSLYITVLFQFLAQGHLGTLGRA